MVELSRFAASVEVIFEQHRSAGAWPDLIKIVVYEKHQCFICHKQNQQSHCHFLDGRVAGDHPDHGPGLRQPGGLPTSVSVDGAIWFCKEFCVNGFSFWFLFSVLVIC
jgi:hypothetical protein